MVRRDAESGNEEAVQMGVLVKAQEFYRETKGQIYVPKKMTLED